MCNLTAHSLWQPALSFHLTFAFGSEYRMMNLFIRRKLVLTIYLSSRFLSARWDSILGNGFSAFFFDADVPFQVGAAGKGLVYMTNYPYEPAGSAIGLGGAYIAVFIDALGESCYGTGSPLAETVCLVGSVVGFGNGSTIPSLQPMWPFNEFCSSSS